MDKKNIEDQTEDSLLESIRTTKLLVSREKELHLYQYKIGLLCSEILENPQEKLPNLLVLLKLLNERTPGVTITVQKLATASLFEVFKDILPSYFIKTCTETDVKYKHETLKLQRYEVCLLEYYKKFLKNLERLADIFKNKKHEIQFHTPDLNLGILSINCLSNLLILKPNFNFSTNIAKYLIPFLACNHRKIRKIIESYFIQMFQNDKRGELSLTMVRGINKLTKERKHLTHPEIYSVLLYLNINQEKNPEEYMYNRSNKNMYGKKKFKLSKKERENKIKLQQIEKEVLETKAEENLLAKTKISTQIKILLFTIYFRSIKITSNSTVLSICLEGLSKFSNSLNINFHQNIISMIINLLDSKRLSVKDQLHCIYTASVMLSEEDSTLSIEPMKFYNYFYNNLLNIHLGITQNVTDILFKILIHLFSHKYKNISENCALAFMKRMSIMSLNLELNSILGIICNIRMIIQRSKMFGVLFETDCTVGDGRFLPELNNPEYCKARCTCLWEIVAWQRHYHRLVENIARSLKSEVINVNESYSTMEILKLSPEELYQNFNPAVGIFNPNIVFLKKKLRTAKQMNMFTKTFNEVITNACAKNNFYANNFDIFRDIKN